MIKVGLIGEDPNDTSAIKNLLDNRYKDRVQFKLLVKGIKGHHLDSVKIKKKLPIEFEDQHCKFIVYIRDLDAFKSQKDKLQAKTQWFRDLDALVNNKGILLLNIWELEALIFGDIEAFNKIYKTKYKATRDPMLIKEPKELLKNLTIKSPKRQFHESHCPEIFSQLNIDKLEAKCSCFKDFITEFNEKISS